MNQFRLERQKAWLGEQVKLRGRSTTPSIPQRLCGEVLMKWWRYIKCPHLSLYVRVRMSKYVALTCSVSCDRQGISSRLRDFCADVRWDPATSNTVGNWLFRSLDLLICRPISYVIRRPTLWALGRLFRDRKSDDQSMMSLNNSSAEIIVIEDLVQVRQYTLI